MSKSVFFEGVGHFERTFRAEGGAAYQYCWCQKTRVNALSCGISQYPQCIVWFCHKARVWQTNGRTNRRIDGGTDRRTELRLPIPR